MYSRPITPYYDEPAFRQPIFQGFDPSVREIRRPASRCQEANTPAKAYLYSASPDLHSPPLFNQRAWSSKQTLLQERPAPLKVYQAPAPHPPNRLQAIQEEKTGESPQAEQRPPTRRTSPKRERNFEMGTVEKSEGVKRPRTTQSRTTKIPVIVTKGEGGSRRVLSAHKAHAKPTAPLMKPKKLNFCSSLDPEFLELFESC